MSLNNKSCAQLTRNDTLLISPLTVASRKTKASEELAATCSYTAFKWINWLSCNTLSILFYLNFMPFQFNFISILISLLSSLHPLSSGSQFNCELFEDRRKKLDDSSLIEMWEKISSVSIAGWSSPCRVSRKLIAWSDAETIFQLISFDFLPFHALKWIHVIRLLLLRFWRLQNDKENFQ